MLNRLLFLVLVCAATASVSASTIRYTYQGGQYNDIDAGVPDGVTGVTAWIALAAPLDPNEAFDFDNTITPIAWYISDGLNVITHETPGFELVASFGTENGEIVEWRLTARTLEDSLGLRFIATNRIIIFDIAEAQDRSVFCDELGGPSGCAEFSVGELRNMPGVWTATAVPVPAAFWLMLSGLAILTRRHIRQ